MINEKQEIIQSKSDYCDVIELNLIEWNLMKMSNIKSFNPNLLIDLTDIIMM